MKNFPLFLGARIHRTGCIWPLARDQIRPHRHHLQDLRVPIDRLDLCASHGSRHAGVDHLEVRQQPRWRRKPGQDGARRERHHQPRHSRKLAAVFVLLVILFFNKSKCVSFSENLPSAISLSNRMLSYREKEILWSIRNLVLCYLPCLILQVI